jgi:two-component system sensor histidine kinase PhoQ
MTDSDNINTPLNSLRTRIMVSALLVIVVVLPSIGFALNNAFKAQVEENLKDQLNAYFYSVLAVTEFENSDLIMPEALLENQFNVINSGLYALISSAQAPALTDEVEPERLEEDRAEQVQAEQAGANQGNILWFSNSFLGADFAQDLPSPALGENNFDQIEVNGEAHFIYSFSVRFDIATTNKASPIITLHIIKDLSAVTQQQNAFSQKLWTWLLILMLVLLVIQVFWLNWTLKPLARFTEELNNVQNGEAEQLSQQYPKELASVATQLNRLLSTEQQQRKRYRNALSDLAHSLKTPLAVIQSQQDLSSSSQAQISQINRTIDHQLKRAQSAGSNAWHLGVKIHTVTDKLLRTLAKIYPDIQIDLNNESALDAVFRGDENDLMEMIGNLLDNACKAASHKVLVSIEQQAARIIVSVEDDGSGISPLQKSQILQRGKRADTYASGHGIGLAIVQDLVENYNGHLDLATSASLGGAKFILSL